MSKITTEWILELGNSSSELQGLLGDVTRFKDATKAATDEARNGYSRTSSALLDYRKNINDSVNQQLALKKLIADSGIESIVYARKEQDAIDINIKKQQALKKEIADTSAARGAGNAVSGAVPNAASANLAEALRAQVKYYTDAKTAAIEYTNAAVNGLAAAKNKAAEFSEEAKLQKDLVAKTTAELRKLQDVEKQYLADKSASSPGRSAAQANANLEANAKAQADITRQLVEQESEYKDLALAAQQANAEVGKREQALKAATAAQKAAVSAEKEAINNAKIQGKELGLLGGLEKQLTDLITKRQQAQSKTTVTGLNKDISAVQKQIAELKSVGASGGGLTGFNPFSGILGSLSGVLAGVVSIGAAISTVKQGIQDFADEDSLQRTFTALAGSATAGALQIAFVREQADKLGLTFVPTARAYTGLFAAAKEANIALKDTQAVFIGLTSAGRVLGRSQQEVESALRAVEQMISKGTVQSQELKLQLGNALPGASQLAAKALGVTTAELYKMLEAGKVVTSDFLPKFAAELKRAYVDGSADAADSLAANLGRIDTYFTQQSARVGKFFAPVVKAFADLVAGSKKAAEVSADLVGANNKQNKSLEDLKNNINPLISRYDALSSNSARSKDEQIELQKVIQDIGRIMPGVVTAFNQYGLALDINSDKVRSFIKLQENVVRLNNKDRIEQNSAQLRQLLEEQKKIQTELNNTVTDPATGLKVRQTASGSAYGGAAVMNLSVEESKAITDDLTKKLTRVQEDVAANLENRQLLRGKSPLVPVSEADVKSASGLIEDLKQKIKELSDLREKVNAEDKSDKNPNGKGSKANAIIAIDEYTKQIKEYQKQLDDLLGKDKAASSKLENQRLAALRRLQAEEERLRKALNAARLNGLKDEGQALAAEQLKQDLEAIKAFEDNLKKYELALAKKGGKGVNADGKINADQRKQLDNLTLLANESYNEKIADIERRTQQKLLDLSKDSYAKQMAQLNAYYEEQIRVAKVAGNERVAEALETARQIAAAELSKNIDLKKIDNLQENESLDIQLKDPKEVNVFGDPQAAIKRFFNGSLSVQDELQKQLLENQIKNDKARIEVLKNSLIEEDKTRVKGLRLGIKNAEKEVKELNKGGVKFDLAKLLGVSEEDRKDFEKGLATYADSAIGSISSILQSNIEIANKSVEARKNEVTEKGAELDREIAMNKQGFASNVKTKKDEYEESKKAREKALQDQRKAQKDQLVLDTVTQVSGLVTASADVFKGFSKIPFIGVPLAIAAIGSMFGFFAAAKVRAAKAAKFEHGGLIGGKLHRDGGNRFYSAEGDEIEHEKGEFVTSRKATNKFYKWLHTINVMDEGGLDRLSLERVAAGRSGGISALAGFSAAKAAESTARRTDTLRNALSAPFGLLSSGLSARGEQYLKKISENTAPQTTIIETESKRIIKSGNYTKIINK